MKKEILIKELEIDDIKKEVKKKNKFARFIPFLNIILDYLIDRLIDALLDKFKLTKKP